MREFPTAARLDRRLAAKRLPRAALAEFGARLARFHAGLRPVRGVAADEIGATALRNIDELAEYLDRGSRSKLATLQAWTQLRGARLAALFASRAAAGAHRECHGDLHLQNLLWRDGAIMAFDALEFDRKLRDIDVISEVAFLAMDLHAHERADLSYEFMNRYLEVSGDYARRRRAALLPRPARVGPRQGRRHQTRAGGAGRHAATTTISQRHSSSRRARNRCSSSRTACPAAARPP